MNLISQVYYADRVYQLPLGVIGIAVGTALLPMLTRQIRSGNEGPANETLNRAVELSMLFTLPAAAALMMIAEPIIRVLFEHGAFSPAATKTTTEALIAFSSGLPAYVLTKVYAPGFFAREDTTTPVIIGIIAMIINIALSLFWLDTLAHMGIALATSVAAWANASILFILLLRKGQHSPDRRLFIRLVGMLLASAAMSAVLYFVQPYLDPMLMSDLLITRVLGLGLLIAAGGATYGMAALLFGAAKLSDLKSMLRRRTPEKQT
ncbi:MAG: polysaccharide biosynthesis C-terminal domain-containing protein [Sneathiella sp.]|nr:polysaccharide biosynthesis C-terminal domain-containing protein [Sneathiella sp.]